MKEAVHEKAYAYQEGPTKMEFCVKENVLNLVDLV